jgi:hypothetical protein
MGAPGGNALGWDLSGVKFGLRDIPVLSFTALRILLAMVVLFTVFGRAQPLVPRDHYHCPWHRQNTDTTRQSSGVSWHARFLVIWHHAYRLEAKGA